MTGGSQSWTPPNDYVYPTPRPGAAPCRETGPPGRVQTVRDLLGPSFPRIVCLCGSTRFKDAFEQANLSETLAGRVVLSVGCTRASDAELGILPDAKQRLDELHLRKIELADEVLVLNVDGYIGPSTGNELAYALALGKPVRTLEPLDPSASPGESAEAGLEAWKAATQSPGERDRDAEPGTVTAISPQRRGESRG